jgi:hypothetical protein
MGARDDLAAVTSVLVDLDHFVDLAYHRLTGDRWRQIIPLHAIELVPFLLLRRSPPARGVAVGLMVHYCIDLFFGGYALPQLSIVWRMSRRMRTGRMGDWVLWPWQAEGWRAMFGSARSHDRA